MTDKKVQKSLYYIACLVPSPIKGEITSFMKEIEKLVGAKHAQKSPPHITLYPPFRIEPQDEINVIKGLTDIAASTQKFEILLKGFSGFSPRTFYVNPLKNKELAVLREKTIDTIGNAIEMNVNKMKSRSFNPHITIANRDLEKKDYPVVVKHFSTIEFNRRYEQDSISLLKHNGKNWDVLVTSSFGLH